MSELVSQLYIPQPVGQVAQALQALEARGAVLPCQSEGSTVLVAWEDWAKLEATLGEVWAIVYTDDAPALTVQGYRQGACWLDVSLNPDPEDDPYDLDEMLDEEGSFPDGSPGPELQRQQSVASVQQAQARGDLSQELGQWLLAALDKGRPAAIRRVWKGVAARLGFGLSPELNVEMLEHLTAQEWQEDYAGAVVLD